MSPSCYVERWLRERSGNKCEKCGWNTPHPNTGNPPLQVDHSDGNGANNKPDNLLLLCPNCHSLTPTWGNHKRKQVSGT